MRYTDFTALDISASGSVLTVGLNNPPLNLLDSVLIPELKRFVRDVATDDATRVIVLESVVPGFFAAHVDAGYGTDPAGFMALGADDSGHDGLNPMQHLIASIRALPQVTIAKLRGYLRGGGNELAMATDLRYAAAGETWLGQIEGRMGIIPGGGGTQLLARAIGRSRTLEAVLTADLYDAGTAELYGWITRAIPVADFDTAVGDIARRIGSRSPAQIRAAKAAIDPTTAGDRLDDDLRVEGAALAHVYPSSADVEQRMTAALADGLQTPQSERDLETFLDQYSGMTAAK